MGLLDGKWVMVTGAGRGIGRALAIKMAGEGAKMVLVARTRSELDGVADECQTVGSRRALTIPADLSDPVEVTQVAKAALQNTGGIHVLINNAGIHRPGNVLEGEPDDWDEMFAVNVSAPIHLTRELAPTMVKNKAGTIINIGSVAGLEPMTQGGAYAASKWALRGWSLSSYERLRHDGIKVMLINPGFVATDMTQGISGVIPERMLQTADVAEAAMLAIRTSPACCPQEITLRLTRSAYAT